MSLPLFVPFCENGPYMLIRSFSLFNILKIILLTHRSSVFYFKNQNESKWLVEVGRNVAIRFKILLQHKSI